MQILSYIFQILLCLSVLFLRFYSPFCAFHILCYHCWFSCRFRRNVGLKQMAHTVATLTYRVNRKTKLNGHSGWSPSRFCFVPPRKSRHYFNLKSGIVRVAETEGFICCSTKLMFLDDLNCYSALSVVVIFISASTFASTSVRNKIFYFFCNFIDIYCRKTW